MKCTSHRRWEEVSPTNRIWTAKPLLIAYVIAVGFTIGLLVSREPALPAAVPALAQGEYRGHADPHSGVQELKEPPIWLQLFRPSEPTARTLLRAGLPLLAVVDGSATADQNRNLVVYWTGQAGEKPQSLFQATLPFLRAKPMVVGEVEPAPPLGNPNGESGPPTDPRPPARPEPSQPGEGQPGVKPTQPPPVEQPIAGGLPLIGIYHTHDWESYLSEFPGLGLKDLNRTVSFDHSKRTVVTLGETLAKRLNELGVTSVHAPHRHSDVPYAYAYTASLKTAREILRKYPSTKVLIDIHRDGVMGLDSKVVIQGKEHARIRCIIGSHQQPKWEKNKAFCDSVMARMEAKWPGITLPTRVQPDTYNQDLMVGAILLEIGNAPDQYIWAERSVLLLAEVLAEMARAGEYPK